MRNAPPRAGARAWLSLTPVLLLGLLTGLQHWLSSRRPPPPELRAEHTFVVSQTGDRGAGSLREAIFLADRAPERARIELAVERVALRSALPPLVNPRGVIVDAPGGCDLDARSLTAGPVLDVAAPGSLVRGLVITGAPEQAVLVRVAGVELRDLTLAGSAEGVHAVAGSRGLVVRDSRFEGNGIGIRLATEEPGVVIAGNRFRDHEDAAIWAVRPRATIGAGAAAVLIHDNELAGDRIGMVLGNVSAAVENNELIGALEAGIYLLGSGVTVLGNRIRDGERFGIYVEAGENLQLTGNEIDRNMVAVLVHSGRGVIVRDNRIHANGYGVIDVFGDAADPDRIVGNQVFGQTLDGLVVFGGAPILRANRALRNRLAGLRLFDVLTVAGEMMAAAPVLEENVVTGNGLDQPVRQLYRLEPPADVAEEGAGETRDEDREPRDG